MPEPNPNEPTQMKRRLGRQTAVERDPIPTENGIAMRDRSMEGLDWTHLTPEERQAYGIRDDEVIAWARNPRVWLREEGADRGLQVMRQGGRVVLKDGMPVTCGEDVMLVAYPKALMEEREKAHKQAQDDFVRRIETQEWPGQFDPTNIEKHRETVDRMREEWRRQIAQGMGSPTRGLPIDAVDTNLIPREAVELMEMKARRGGRTPRPDEVEVERKLVERLEKSERRGKRYYSIP